MDSSFGPLDAFTFLVFAILIAVAVIVIVKLGQLPGQLARKWGHPQAAAINAASWVGIATGGLLWPLAFIWAFTTPIGSLLFRTAKCRSWPIATVIAPQLNVRFWGHNDRRWCPEGDIGEACGRPNFCARGPLRH